MEILKQLPLWFIGIIAFVIMVCFLYAVFSGREVDLWGFKIGKKVPSEKSKPEVIDQEASLKPPAKKDLSVIPDYYDFGFLKENLIERFGKQIGILVIQYGSSIREPQKAIDDDYVVLVHGGFYNEDTERLDQRFVAHPLHPLGKAVDIQVIIYDSFLTGLIIGKPFEISVATDGVVKDSYNITRKYWDWCKVLAHNIMVDVVYLKDRILEDINDLKIDFSRAIKEQNEYKIIVAAYHICSDYIKMKVLNDNAEAHVPAQAIYPLSQSSFLAERIENGERRGKYEKLSNYFKHNKTPDNWLEFHTELNDLIKFLEKEAFTNAEV